VLKGKSVEGVHKVITKTVFNVHEVITATQALIKK